MKIEPDPKLRIEPEKPDYAEEIARKTAPPTLDQDSIERGDTGNIFQEPFPGVKATDEATQKLLDAVEEKNRKATEEALGQPKKTQSSGGGTFTTQAVGEKKFEIIDGSSEKKSVIAGDEDALPDDLRDLGTYDGGTDLVSGDLFLHKRSAIREASGDLGTIYAHNQLQAVGLQGRIFYDADASIEDLTLKGGIGAEGKIELVGTYNEFGYTTPSVDLAGHDVALTAKVKVDFSVSARGFVIAEGSIGKDTYLKIGGEAFVGASWTIEGEADVGEYADAHAGMDIYAGIGAKGEATIGLEDGEFTVDFEAGLAWGYGVGFDVGVDVNFLEIGETLFDLAKGGLEGAEAFGGWMSGFVGAGGDAAGDFFGGLANFAEDTYDAAGDVVDDVVDAAEDTGEAIVNTVEDGAEAVGDFVSDVVDW